MDETFSEQESLLRAVYPATRRPDFWNNGRLSSAALKDKRGRSAFKGLSFPSLFGLVMLFKHISNIVHHKIVHTTVRSTGARPKSN